jgi:hypothetical protein
MKKIIIISVLFLSICDIYAQVITDLEIYYLPWSIRPEAVLSANDVRNFNHGQNSYLCIQDTLVIKDFIRSMSIFYLSPFPEKKTMDHVMVIDIHFRNSDTKTLGLNFRQHILYSNVFYFRNFELSKWIDKYVPPAKIPGRF